ncbi:hypothetical protein [Pontibacter kalidii]|uniref:hypothetical protein n=1 Tax=Pontibacter kalidii TaxID=2592049 RepID=UPI002252AEB2|nr:hypothetical protein [Pontibacter kalidii]
MRLVITFILLLIVSQVNGQIDLSKPFQDCHAGGSITLYDYQAKKWIHSSANNSHIGTLPASTF